MAPWMRNIPAVTVCLMIAGIAALVLAGSIGWFLWKVVQQLLEGVS